MMNAGAWLLLLGKYHTSASVTLIFWSPNKNSTTSFLKLKGKEAFSQAERLFPSDNSLSQLKCEQKTWGFTSLWWIPAAPALCGSRTKRPSAGSQLQVNHRQRMEKVSQCQRAGHVWPQTATPCRCSTFQSKWHLLELGSTQPVCCYQKRKERKKRKKQGFSF